MNAETQRGKAATKSLRQNLRGIARFSVIALQREKGEMGRMRPMGQMGLMRITAGALPVRLFVALLLCCSMCLDGGAQQFMGNKRRAFCAATGSWVPTDIAGCQLWLAADYGATNSIGNLCANNEAAASWSDRSGNQSHVFCHIAGPVWSNNIQNSLPALWWNATGPRNITNTATATTFSGTDKPMTFAVALSMSTNADHYIFRMGNTADSDPVWYFVPNAAMSYTVRKRDNGAVSLINYSFSPSATNTWAAVIFVVANNSARVFRDGFEVGSSQSIASGPLTLNYMHLGRSGSSGTLGLMGEIIIYDTAISDANRTAVFNYLKTRWGTP